MLPESMQQLRHKILGLLSLGILSVGIIAFYSLSLLSDKIERYDRLIEDKVFATALAENINLNFKRQVQEWKNVLLRGHKQDDRDKYWRQFTELQAAIQSDVTLFLSKSLDPQFSDKMRNFQQQHQNLYVEYQRGYEEFVAAGNSHIVGDQTVRGIDREPTKLLETLAIEMSELTSRDSNEISTAATVSVRIAITAIVIAIIVSGVVAALFMNKKVVQPLTMLIELLRGVSRGNYSESLVFERSDEIGSMSRAIERLRQNLESINTELASSRIGLDEVCDSLQESATAINSGVKEQNSGTSSVTESMHQMSEMASRVDQNASDAATEAQAMQLAAQESQQVMSSTIATIKDSSEQIQNTAQVIQRLDDDANNVGSVIDVIQGIAEQTNLLALNAAIEAARAGEQGRGFAVVADEVRTLASRTQQSTEEIKQIIADLQTGAKNAVSAIQQGQQQSEASVDKVLEAESNIKRVSTAIDQISHINSQIASAISDQSRLSEQITKQLDGLNDIAKTNGTHADSCAEDNKKLSVLSIRMGEAIDKLQGKHN